VVITCVLAASSRAGTLVQFRTPLGDLPVELLDDDKPATVRKFLSLVRADRYQHTFFHRCVTNFVLQGGGFTSTTPDSTNPVSVVNVVPGQGFITNEFNIGRRFSNTFGTLAMAKTNNNPDSASVHWFFNLADNSANLDLQNGGFTVFGHLLGDTNLLHSFNHRQPGSGIYNAGGTFATLPVLPTNGLPPRYVDLIYVDISLLRVAVAPSPDGSMIISWLSASNLMHVVEYTDVFPPAWQELARVAGTGQSQDAIDAPAVAGRFYRVRSEVP
jgi:peptidyl-prolyl cis-trans isomerase A (cyclophilin A)